VILDIGYHGEGIDAGCVSLTVTDAVRRVTDVGPGVAAVGRIERSSDWMTPDGASGMSLGLVLDVDDHSGTWVGCSSITRLMGTRLRPASTSTRSQWLSAGTG